MRKRLSRIATLLTAASLMAALPVMAQEASKADIRALIQACRPDYQRLCSDVAIGNGAVLTCLRQHENDLSSGCRDAAQQMRGHLPTSQGTATTDKALTTRVAATDAAGEQLPSGTRVLRDIAYGSDPQQRFDVYLPASVMAGVMTGTAATGTDIRAPILVMVHGGAWIFGDKAAPGVVGNKAAYWLSKGYVFVSVNNRLLPSADPLIQTMDVALAMTAIEQNAPSWHADAGHIVLMGHSAGAHLVVLLTVDPSIAAGMGLKPWLGTVALDSAALNVPAIMAKGHASFYNEAFGADKDYWRKISPIDRLSAEAAPLPMLLVCSSQRRDSCDQATAFAAQVTAHAGHAEVLPEDLSHDAINQKLGEPMAYTQAVAGFMQSLGLP